MRKIALILFLIFIYSRIPISHCYYSLWEQDIFVEKNDHILINITTLDGLVSDHILQTSGNIQITLKYSNDNAIFDVFLLDDAGYQCYNNSLNFLGEQTSTCPFVTESSQSFLKQNTTTISLGNMTTTRCNIVIDNTKFPEDIGAYHFSKLELKFQVNLTIIASSAYYNAFIALVLILAFVVVVGTIVVVIFFFKLRKAEKKIKRGKKEYLEYKFKETKGASKFYYSKQKMFFKVIVGPFLILTLIYFILSIFSLIRMFNLFKSKNSYTMGITFYIIILIHCLFRTASSCYLTFVSFDVELNQNHSYIDDFSKVFVNILYIPDLFFWDAFAILFFQLLELFQKGHMSSSRGDFLEEINTKHPLNSDLAVQCLIMVVLLGSGTQVVMLCLFNLDMFHVFNFIIENAVYNLIIPFVLLITEIILHVKFSGIPYRSLFDSENKSKINKRIIYWGVTRSLQGIFDIISSASKMPTFFLPNSEFFYEDDINSIVFIVSIIAGKIVTEIIPFGIVFDKEFITIFFQMHFLSNSNNKEFEINLLDQESKKAMKNGKDSQILGDDILNISNHSSEIINKNDDSVIIDVNLKKIDYNLVYFDPNIKERKRNNGLGTIRLGYFNKEHTNKVSIRRIDIPKQKFSKYILEEIFKDMNKYMNYQINYKNYIIKFKGYYISQNSDSLIFFYDHYHNGSLSTMLWTLRQNKIDTPRNEIDKDASTISISESSRSAMKKINMTYEFKLKLIYQIANAIHFLHSNETPVIHGHITPSNILFNAKHEPVIADLGFVSLKKYCKFMIGYSNKNEYTAPEYLEEKSNIVENPRVGADIYSFGMIVWELITENKPFKLLSKDELVNKVVIEKIRPKIPDNIPTEISQIIRACWQHEEEKRPSFGKIVKILENLI